MNKKTIITIEVVILIALGGIGYLAYTKYSQKPEPVKNEVNLPESIVPLSLHTYTDTTNNYSLKYPGGWIYEKLTENQVVFKDGVGSIWAFQVDIASKSKSLVENSNELENELIKGGYTVKSSDTVIGGLKARKLSLSGVEGLYGDTIEIVVFNGKVYKFSLGIGANNDETAILSSVQFNDPFDLAHKTSTTKVYISDALGVGFSYEPISTDLLSHVKVSEIGSKIFVYHENDTPEQGQSIEVFEKDPNISFQQALENKFLTGFDPKNCFIKIYENSAEQNHLLANYVQAGISFPPSTDPNEPGWINNEKCPANYSETNDIRYFLYNKDVPGKYVFIKVGQDSITTDGTPADPTTGFYGHNWSASIKILK